MLTELHVFNLNKSSNNCWLNFKNFMEGAQVSGPGINSGELHVRKDIRHVSVWGVLEVNDSNIEEGIKSGELFFDPRIVNNQVITFDLCKKERL